MLAISRILVAWQPLGLAMGVYDMCSRYLQEREQFGVPLASFQASPLCQAAPSRPVHQAVDRSSDCCNVCAGFWSPFRASLLVSLLSRDTFFLSFPIVSSRQSAGQCSCLHCRLMPACALHTVHDAGQPASYQAAAETC